MPKLDKKKIFFFFLNSMTSTVLPKYVLLASNIQIIKGLKTISIIKVRKYFLTGFLIITKY